MQHCLLLEIFTDDGVGTMVYGHADTTREQRAITLPDDEDTPA
ncbi:Uncharacterised protein [Mycobacteroides abscessus subsp. abscessus]|nr:Uncharacterised protein [Mycobacteroides abscessus subsp. abscessus]